MHGESDIKNRSGAHLAWHKNQHIKNCKSVNKNSKLVNWSASQKWAKATEYRGARKTCHYKNKVILSFHSYYT